MPFKIDKKDSTYKEMREFFKMMGFPTVIVLGSDGVERDRQIGFGGDAEGFLTTMKDWSQNRNTLSSYIQEWTKDSTNVEWNFRVAERYANRYQNDLAQPYFENILNLDPTDNSGYKQVALFNIALYDARTNANPEKLAAHLETETDDGRIRTGYFSLARVYEAKNDVAKAVNVYKAALQKMPEDAGLMNACAWFIYEQQAAEYFQWGIELARKAVQLEANEASVWDTLAWLLHSNGQYQEAVDAMKKCVELDPDADYFVNTLKKMQRDLEKNI